MEASKQSEDTYLEEDEDLLRNLESIGPMSTGTALEGQKYQINAIQIKVMLRTRKTMSTMDASTTKFSVMLIALAIVQFTVAVFQLIVAATAPDKWFGLAVVIVCFGIIVYMLRKFDEVLEKK